MYYLAKGAAVALHSLGNAIMTISVNPMMPNIAALTSMSDTLSGMPIAEFGSVRTSSPQALGPLAGTLFVAEPWMLEPVKYRPAKMQDHPLSLDDLIPAEPSHGK